MKSHSFISTLLVLIVASSSLAFAQGHSNRGKGGDTRVSKEKRHPAHHAMPQVNQGHAWGHDNLERDRRWAQQGAGPNHQFRRGDRLPMEYRHSHYVVNDWRSHNLAAPPRGYHWVQSGGDYILVAITTGLILQILLNH